MLFVKSINIISFKTAYWIYPIFKSFDSDNAFMVIVIHHIMQAFIAFSIICGISLLCKIKIKEFGFNFNQFGVSIKLVLIFTGIWTIIQTIGGIIIVKIMHIPSAFTFPLNIKNFIGYFLFEILLSGTSEEIVFRALVITSVLYIWKNLFLKQRNLYICAVLVSTMIFMFDHINFSYLPLRITYINYLQQITVFIFGIFYGYLMVKTKSIVGSIFAHNLLNGVITIIGFILLNKRV
ncbi:hypothetical protein Q428_04120 [Fervidicella metallireducens AeB]|uniref:CAAX prenyl protease 2/Lysostaphin resistance protein A-like domain-containing protein n=1 Tax=Fervidicella metallireducens AeB TaxID=1403537 RepID=A0A017RZ13_9CLOT|nr:CPBP family intramembrane glutamic endopeptidase [Fervidicella metallireducens]EYE89170.1 hypothetical protein Q428_04120 [Fervidicella metallireducens AeB]